MCYTERYVLYWRGMYVRAHAAGTHGRRMYVHASLLRWTCNVQYFMCTYSTFPPSARLFSRHVRPFPTVLGYIGQVLYMYCILQVTSTNHMTYVLQHYIHTCDIPINRGKIQSDPEQARSLLFYSGTPFCPVRGTAFHIAA